MRKPFGWILDAFNLYFTKDGGNTWEKSLSYKDKYLLAQPGMFFLLNDQTILVCDAGDNSGRIYKTNNSGQSWHTEKVIRNSSSPCGIFFINEKEGWYSSGQQVFHSGDVGQRWERLTSLPNRFEVCSMFWLSSNQGWLAGFFQNSENNSPMFGKGAILKTLDGGKTWTEIPVDDKNPFFTQIYFSDSQIGWLVSRDSIYVTSNGGADWRLSFSLPSMSEK
jgi:photosystem II stability/assembly factor-like uncharacterized protein